MEIPDLNYSSPNNARKWPQTFDFYSVEENKSQSSKAQIQTYSAYEDSFNSILQDQLEKKTMNIGWQSRYFCLTSTRLLYYLSKNKQELKGCFNLLSLSKQYLIFLEVREEQKTLKLTLYLEHEDENQFRDLIFLNFEHVPERYIIWKNQLNKMIEIFSKTSKQSIESPRIPLTQILTPQHKTNFWNKILISMDEFHQYANHLDIVFFKSKKPFAAFQRLFMRSQFDHVAILLKDNRDNILILQAIQSRGVWINEWNQMLPIFKEHYQQIAYRKLLIDKKDQIDLQKLQAYLDMIIGTKYQLSFSKLFIPEQTQIMDQENNTSKNQIQLSKTKKKIQRKKSFQENKTFFCSQLIADIYIKLGLIQGRKRNQFWPRDFEGVLKLQNNIKLSPLMHLSLE